MSNPQSLKIIYRYINSKKWFFELRSENKEEEIKRVIYSLLLII